MKHYKDQLKHWQTKHLAAKDSGDDKLAEEYQAHIDDYETMQSQVK